MTLPFRKIALSLLFSGAAFFATAQVTTQSPYSRYGLGDLASNSLAQNFGMGGFGIGFAEKTVLNLQNAAAPSFLAKPTFDIGIKHTTQTLQNTALTEKSSTTFINHFAYAFPFKSTYTLTVGLIPMSRVGYRFNDNTTIADSINVLFDYRGSGGLTKAFLGNSYQIINNDSTNLAVGFNINYIFGTLNKERRAYYGSENYLNVREISATTFKDFAFDLGALYSFYPGGRSTRLTLGATYGLASSLRAEQETLSQTFALRTSGSEVPVDTVDYINDKKGTVKLPSSFGFGTSVLVKNKLMIGVDYFLQNWSTFGQTINNEEIKDNLRNSSRLSFGLQYTPRQQIVYNSPIFHFCSYRIGFRNETTYLQLRNTAVKSSAVSTGISIPLRRSNSGSRITLGYEYSTRGTLANNLIKENYSTFMLGISLAPNANDRWFFKRKYD